MVQIDLKAECCNAAMHEKHGKFAEIQSFGHICHIFRDSASLIHAKCTWIEQMTVFVHC